jgi:hypothetical protein
LPASVAHGLRACTPCWSAPRRRPRASFARPRSGRISPRRAARRRRTEQADHRRSRARDPARLGQAPSLATLAHRRRTTVSRPASRRCSVALESNPPAAAHSPEIISHGSSVVIQAIARTCPSRVQASASIAAYKTPARDDTSMPIRLAPAFVCDCGRPRPPARRDRMPGEPAAAPSDRRPHEAPRDSPEPTTNTTGRLTRTLPHRDAHPGLALGERTTAAEVVRDVLGLLDIGAGARPAQYDIAIAVVSPHAAPLGPGARRPDRPADEFGSGGPVRADCGRG